VTSVSPSVALVGVTTTVTVTGSGFIQSSVVQVNGAAKSTTFVSTSQLQATLAASDLAATGTAQITVVNPAPGGGTSAAVQLAVDNPVPVVTSLSPSIVIAGSAPTTVIVNGSGFISSSTVLWNGSARQTTFVSGTQLQAALTTADLASGLNAQITVTNAAPGGGTSAAAAFTVNNPAPMISLVSPSSTVAGSPSTTVTVNGSGFISSSTVLWNGSARQTTFVNSTQLQGSLTAADLASGVNAQISVINAAPGGGTSAAASFSVNNPAPVVSSLSASAVTITDAGSALLINGSGFVPTSTVLWNGSARTTAFISSTQVQITIAAADVSLASTAQISVSNPAPGGGTSAALPLTIQYAFPTITSLSPSLVVVGSASFTLVVNGTGFAPVSTVQWNGSPRTTNFVSGARLTAVISASDVAAQGTAQVTVTTPSPGGGTSTAAVFTISVYPVPVVSNVSPNSIVVNSPDTPVAVFGSGFGAASVVQWNGTNLTTSFVNSSRLNTTIPAADLTTTGTNTITVFTPAPGGGTSNGVSVSVLVPPAPTLTSISPSAIAIGSSDLSLSAYGSNFVSTSVVLWNGSPRPTTFASSGQLTATIPSSDVAAFGTAQVSVQTPAPGGGITVSLPLTTYLALPANDLVYSPMTQLLYASVPSSAGPTLGNSVVSIDPYTGTLGTPIWVGSEPNKLSISNDGTTMWVSLSGAPSVKKVDLTAGQVTPVELYFGGGWGYNNYATDVAVLPGFPNSVAVSSNLGVSIYDDAVQRPNITTNGGSYLAFGVDASTLYGAGGSSIFAIMAVNNTGIASTTTTSAGSYSNDLRVDNGLAYLTSGQVLNASTGALVGTFAATGPVAPDSTIGRAYILNSGSQFGSSPNQITAFDIATMVPVGSIPVAGVNTGSGAASSLVRWGQDGLAFRTATQVYVLRSMLVRDLSASPADLAVSISPPVSGSTGNPATFTVTVTNNGPSTADHVTLIVTLSSNASPVSTTPGQGICSGTSVARCALGSMTSGASVATTVVVTPITAGSVSVNSSVSGLQADPNLTNNAATASTPVTGSDYSVVPVAYAVVPSSAGAGSATFNVSVNGANFASEAVVNWNGTTLPTTFVSSTQLTATVNASLVTTMGTAVISVTNPAPGGGTSQLLPFTIFQTVALDANNIVFDPFSRKFYASVPSTATQLTGNSIVSIDPLTGALGTPVFIGSEPKAVAISDDGKYLYVVLSGSNEVRQFDIATQSPGTRFTTSSYYGGNFAADYVAVMPGSDNTIATTKYANGIQVWDVSSTGAAPRTPTKTLVNDVYEGGPIAWGDATHLYSNDVGLSPSNMHRFIVSPSSFQETDEASLDGMWNNISFVGGLLYADGGGVTDPSPVAPAPPKLVGRYPTGGGATASVADPAIDRVYFLNANNYGASSCAVSIFDAARFLQLGVVTMGSVCGNALDLTRWGSDGLAFLTTTNISGNGTGQIYLFRGAGVLMAGGSNLSPSISSASPASLTSGADNTWLTITGSNFAPGAVAQWNGQDRTTKYVDASHLMVAIPASDLSAPGSFNITVTNPGTGASGPLSFSVN